MRPPPATSLLRLKFRRCYSPWSSCILTKKTAQWHPTPLASNVGFYIPPPNPELLKSGSQFSSLHFVESIRYWFYCPRLERTYSIAKYNMISNKQQLRPVPLNFSCKIRVIVTTNLDLTVYSYLSKYYLGVFWTLHAAAKVGRTIVIIDLANAWATVGQSFILPEQYTAIFTPHYFAW